MLRSNTETTEVRSYDVVVIGGGPHGITYASWIKKWRPDTRIAILEKRSTPGFKIGESLLSSATRSLISTGLDLPKLRRLFGNKAGIRFWWTDEESTELQRHVDVVDIEETFQVERRPLEMALQELASRKGIDVFKGTRVNLRQSNLDGKIKRLVCERADGTPLEIICPMICDASGPAAAMTKHKKLYRKAPEKNNTFTTNTYFAYFRKKKKVAVDKWEAPATRHVCFPGGWMWFISLTSWEETPDENLRQMVHHLLDQDGKDADYPSRQALADQFGCENEQVTSIGFVVREDWDGAKKMTPEEAFRHYAKKLPAVGWVMEHFEPVTELYGSGNSPFHCFKNLVHDAETMTGEGWCSIGDAACFVNPLFSPGLNLGSGGAYIAAQDTVTALDRRDFSKEAFATYQSYCREIYDALMAETDMYYRGFNQIDTYEWTLLLKIFYAAADVVQRDLEAYSESDPYVHGLLNEEFRERVEAVRTVLQDGESGRIGREETVEVVRSIIEPFVRELLQRPDVKSLELDRLFHQYTGEGTRVREKVKRKGPFTARQCESCELYADDSLDICPICGHGVPVDPGRSGEKGTNSLSSVLEDPADLPAHHR